MFAAHEHNERFRTAFWRAVRSQVSIRLAVMCLILWVTVTWFLWANSASPLHGSLVNLSADLHVDVSSTGSTAIHGHVLDGSDESPTRAKGVHRWPVRLEVERQGRGGVVLAEQMRVFFRSGESSQPTVDMKRDLEVARALASDPRLAPWRNDLLNGRLAASREYPMRAMLRAGLHGALLACRPHGEAGDPDSLLAVRLPIASPGLAVSRMRHKRRLDLVGTLGASTTPTGKHLSVHCRIANAPRNRIAPM
jgi:hypothetical protein